MRTDGRGMAIQDAYKYTAYPTATVLDSAATEIVVPATAIRFVVWTTDKLLYIGDNSTLSGAALASARSSVGAGGGATFAVGHIARLPLASRKFYMKSASGNATVEYGFEEDTPAA